MLMDEADAVCAELRRVLRPGGTLAGVDGARGPPSPALDAFVQLYPADSQRTKFAGIRSSDRRFRSQVASLSGLRHASKRRGSKP